MIRFRFIAALLVVIVAWVMCGCTPRVANGGSSQPQDLQSADSYFVGAYVVRDFRLKDGTRCATTSEGGITCDWHKGVE